MYVFSYLCKMAAQGLLTGIPEVDFKILNTLPDRELGRACQTNQYATELCRDDYFWQTRIGDRIGDEYLEGKPEGITWQDWYLFWVNHLPDPIGESLNLDVIQAMTRLLTEDNVVIGSEAYQNIGLVLIKAFESGDVDLVKYFMDLFRKLISNRNINFRQVERPLFVYSKAIVSALANGFIDEAKDILAFSYDESIRLNARDRHYEDTFDYDQVIKMAGEKNLEDFYLDNIRDDLGQLMDPDEADILFIAGLARGGHTEEAEVQLDEFLGVIKTLAIGPYRQLIIGALEGDNLDFIEDLEKYIPGRGFLIDQYREIFATESLVHGHYELALDDEELLSDDIFFRSLIPSYPDLALKHIQANPGIKIYRPLKTCYQPLLEFALLQNLNISPDTKECSHETLLFALNHPKNQKNSDLLIEILSTGRYDLVDVVLAKMRTNRPVFNYVLGKMDTQYKDIYLYLIVKYIEEYSTLPTSITNNNNPSIEGFLLKQQLQNIPVMEIPNADFISILLEPYA